MGTVNAADLTTFAICIMFLLTLSVAVIGAVRLAGF
jgi:hypothetical protein